MSELGCISEGVLMFSNSDFGDDKVHSSINYVFDRQPSVFNIFRLKTMTEISIHQKRTDTFVVCFRKVFRLAVGGSW